MLRVVQIAGFLGCGKTTAMMALSKILSGDYKKKVALVVNEIGEIPVDGEVVEKCGLSVKTLGGGCICCEIAFNFAGTLVMLYKSFNPDIVLTEPTGVAVPHRVKSAALMGGRDCEVSMGPAVVLFDAIRPEELLSEDMLGTLVKKQLNDADVIAINKIDAVDEVRIKYCEEKTREINPKAKLIRLSCIKGDGIEELAKIIIEPKEYPLYPE
jgi:G3E family GTPase